MLANFEEIKQENTLNYKKFEQKRLAKKQKSKKKMIKSLKIEIISIIIATILYFTTTIGWAIMLIVVGTITAFFIWLNSNGTAKDELKNTIYTDIMKMINKSFSFSNIDNNDLIKNLNINLVSSVRTGDFFKGKIQGNNFTIANISINEETNNNDTIHLFRGIFGILDYESNLASTSVSQGFYSNRIFSIIDKKADYLKITKDESFNKKFTVKTSAKSSALSILNEQFIDYLKQLSEKYKVIVFWDNHKIVFACDTKNDLFDINLNKPINEKAIKKFYNLFKTFYDILENIYLSVTQQVNENKIY